MYRLNSEERFEQALKAAERGSVMELDTLLREESSITLINVPGAGTLLHRAAAFGHIGAVRLLIHYGARAEVQDDLGQTPQDLAQAMSRTEVIRFLCLVTGHNPMEHTRVPVGS